MHIQLKLAIRRALIVAKRSTIAALAGLILSVMLPVFGMADSHHIEQQPAASVAEQSTGFKGWFADKWTATKDVVSGKYQAVTDPSHENRILKAQIRGLEAQLALQRVREEVLAEDYKTMQTCFSEINTLFVTGRMQHLIQPVPDVPNIPN